MFDSEIHALQNIIVRNEQVSRVLEFGALNGFSTVNMAMAINFARKEGSIVTVDIFQKDKERDDELLFDKNCAAYQVVNRIEKIKGYSSDRRVTRALTGRKFDLIFHDAEHQYHPVLRDIIIYEPFLNISGYFVFHDYVEKWTLK